MSSLLSALRRPSRRLAAGGLTATLLVGGVVQVAVGQTTGSSGYRTATVAVRSIDQVLDEVAVVEPVTQASMAFPVSGTVATVSVAAGDTVATGDPLATLDTTTLERTLHEEEAVLARAELVLEKALAGEDVSGLTGRGAPTGQSVVLDGSPIVVTLVSAVTTVVDPTDHDVRAAQQAVLEAQRQVDDDLRAAEEALTSAEEVCVAIGDGDPTDSEVATCRDALDAALAAQRAVAASEATLAAAAAALDALLDERASAEPPVTTTTPSSTPAPNPSDTGGSSPTPTATAPSPSSEDLIAYQKAVDAAEVAVAVAQQAIKQAAIVSPIAGTVAAVELEVGDDVTGGSATQAVTVVGDGGYEVTTAVSVDDLPDLELGQPATIIPDGGGAAIDGEVVRIGVAPSSSGATTYPVTIGIDGDGDGLRNGSIASVSIVTSAASDALSVPTSAVAVDGGDATVTVLDGTDAKAVDVEIGAVGDSWTEITSGLVAGQQVVLADLGAALPGSATDGSAVNGRGPDGATFTGGPPNGAFPGGGPPAN